MYQYTDFDKQFVKQRAEQFRDQLERWQRGELTDEQLLPLRLQNGWYIQRYAPMARIAVPYGEISSTQLRTLAHIAREYDRPDTRAAGAGAGHARRLARRRSPAPRCPRRRCAMATATSPRAPTCSSTGFRSPRGRCDGPAGQRGHARHSDQRQRHPQHHLRRARRHCRGRASWTRRPFAEITRQWSSLHPEFAYLPRKFKIAFNGAEEDRAAIGWYDIGLQARRATTTAPWASP
jgi:sulfite reductase (NADPH) hemoprotein beta-component